MLFSLRLIGSVPILPQESLLNSSKRKSLKVGIVDLVVPNPVKSIYGRIVSPNYTSIMPQVLGVWLEELGYPVHYMSYTGTEDLASGLPQDIDVLFISTFTHAALTAYSISTLFRKKGVITILGGPHARSFGEDATRYFDYVLGLTDKPLIQNLLQNLAPNPQGGLMLRAAQQPTTLPGVRQRWKFIEMNLQKAKIVRAVPILGSLGCPYKCSFCIDSQIDYQTLPYEQIREDLRFLAGQPKPPIGGWYDPNFGVRFDEYLDIIEESVPPGRMAFGAESSLALLGEENLKRLKKNRFVVMLPGIESWFDFNGKSKQGIKTGMDKVRATAEHMNMVARYVPYVQTNFIFGLDTDEGDLPFELTKRFIDLAPGIYPNFSLLTSYGNSAPLNQTFQEEGRVLDVPYPFLDGHSGLNIRLKNYELLDFYDRMSDLSRYAFSKRMIAKRFITNKHPLPRWMNFLRGAFSVKGAKGNYGRVKEHYQQDRDFQAFYSGESMKPPSFYHDIIKIKMGPFYPHLPKGILDYLDRGESMPNPRVSNALLPVPASTEPAGLATASA